MLTKYKKKKANSLAEVLIAMSIISTTLIASMTLVTKGLIRVRENEIEDAINGALIESIELAKSPTLVKVNTNISNMNEGSIAYMTLERFDGSRSSQLNLQTLPLADCTESSPYRISDLKSGNALIDACLQIKITKRSQFYEVETLIKYKAKGEYLEKRLIGIRKDDFKT